jgi:hypothetical protein
MSDRDLFDAVARGPTPNPRQTHPSHMVAATLFPPRPSKKWYPYYGM